MNNIDYIIVGAGSAGCVLANRLSEDPAVNVVLLEAGGKDTKLEIHVPAGYIKLHNTKVDWAYRTVPQEDMEGRIMDQPRGKVLGGCSSTNAMAYIRGNKLDYEEWAQMGNPGWDFESVLPYFTRSEDNAQISNRFHGQNGPLYVSRTSFRSPYAEAFIESAVNAGIEANDDFNGDQQEGVGYFQYTIKNGKRWSTAAAFLKPAMKRPNLKVITKAQTTRVLLENKRAVGVEYIKGGKLKQLRCEQEVLLSAGAFGSPQLLMLSGIGPAEHLNEVGIEVEIDLAGVGQNLQDHMIMGMANTAQKGPSMNRAETLPNYIRYFVNKSGPLTSGPLEACAFVKLRRSDRPDIQFHFAPAHGTDMHDYDSLPKKQDGFSILPTLLRPHSVGELRLSSKDPLKYPLINPRYFSEEEDLKTMLEGMKMAVDLVHSDAFKHLGANMYYPANHRTEAGLKEHIIQHIETCYHPVGTCKMGVDQMAVVDPELRVHGVKGLRVIDAAVMPTVISGNTNATAIMIGEKGADLVRGHVLQSKKSNEKVS
ncbi:MAG: GMC family oxidoreductase [Bacteroidia bacterium]